MKSKLIKNNKKTKAEKRAPRPLKKPRLPHEPRLGDSQHVSDLFLDLKEALRPRGATHRQTAPRAAAGNRIHEGSAKGTMAVFSVDSSRGGGRGPWRALSAAGFSRRRSGYFERAVSAWRVVVWSGGQRRDVSESKCFCLGRIGKQITHTLARACIHAYIHAQAQLVDVG